MSAVMAGVGARGAFALAALLLASSLSACSGSDEAPDADSSTTASGDTPQASDPAVTEGLPDGASDLAGAAEDLAASGTRDPNEAVLGGDISWPQCPVGLGIPEKRTLGMPMPLDAAEYVVIGLTNGPGFHPNPCLADQVDWVAERDLLASAYAVGSYPDAATLARYGAAGPFDGAGPHDALRNVGYAQAGFNVDSLRAAALETPFIWIDVEPVPDFEWSPDVEANAAVVEGLARGYTDAGYAIGVYSTPYLWEQVVGDLALGIPEWRAAGHTSAAEALSRCDDEWVIQGGPAVLGQWVEADRDQNLTCPGIAGDLGRYFHQY